MRPDPSYALIVLNGSAVSTFICPLPSEHEVFLVYGIAALLTVVSVVAHITNSLSVGRRVSKKD